MNKKSIVNDLVKIANLLDENNLIEEADIVNSVMVKIAEYTPEPHAMDGKLSSIESNWKYKDYIDEYKEQYKLYVDGKQGPYLHTFVFKAFINSKRFSEEEKLVFRQQASAIRDALDYSFHKDKENKSTKSRPQYFYELLLELKLIDKNGLLHPDIVTKQDLDNKIYNAENTYKEYMDIDKAIYLGWLKPYTEKLKAQWTKRKKEIDAEVYPKKLNVTEITKQKRNT